MDCRLKCKTQSHKTSRRKMELGTPCMYVLIQLSNMFI